MDRNWQADLEHWFVPFSAALGHKTRARMCPGYIAGLIGLGDRKSIPPMAARDSGVNYNQLHHFIGSGVWDATPLEAILVAEADKFVMEAPRPRTPSELQYSDRKLRSRS